MAFQTRKPPIKLMVDIEKYNSLVELVSRAIENSDEKKSQYAQKMKDKLLRYSVPRNDENGETIIDIRFFDNEAQDLINYLMETLNEKTETNYFEVLTKVRESYKQEKMTNE